MFINQTVANEIYEESGAGRLARARNYVKEKRVSIESTYYEDMNNFSVNSIVDGNFDEYKVRISVVNAEINELSCECIDYESHYGTCKHIAATLLEVDGNPKYTGEKQKVKKERYTDFKDLLDTFYQDEIKIVEEKEEEVSNLDTQIELIPKLIYDSYSKEMKVEFKIGTPKQYYRLKDLIAFYENMINGNLFQYGVKLQFMHREESFCEQSKTLLKFLLKYTEMIKYMNSSSNSNYHGYGRLLKVNSITLSNSAIDELFEILKQQEVSLEKNYQVQDVMLIDTNPEIAFELEKMNENEYKLICGMDTYHTYEIIDGRKYTYFLNDDKLYRCTKDFKNATLKLLEVFKRNYTREIKFDETQLANFFSIVYPKVEKNIDLDTIEIEEIENYLPQKLQIKVFLELNQKGYIIAKVLFCYKEKEFNPVKEDPIITRNVIEEVEALNLFRRTGFMVDRKNGWFVLVDDNKIYEFLSNDIAIYMEKFEVLATEDFKEKQIKQPKISSLGVKIENNLLNIELDNLNFDKKELKEILKKYSLKKKYHRLKDGTFLSLEDNDDIDFLNDLLLGTDIKYEEITENKIYLPMYRSLYLDRIMQKMNNVSIKKNETYKEVIYDIEDKKEIQDLTLPNSLEPTLREYQKIGFKWLKALDTYKFGGILADDMGLGKTLQLISIILSYKEEELINQKPILVVCPSSLSLNWKNEINKFASNIKTQVISGSLDQRKRQIRMVEKYDVVITSYDLLKRDIEYYQELDYEFRYVIADEAQYIKNSNTQNAKAIKQIKAETRYALTGTPIENSLSELWSIFDFIMPGYLFGYRKFKELYEMPIVKDNDKQAMVKLKQLIEPFILRRTKKEVLTELPDKTITILNNEMEEEQEKIYLSYLAQAKTELQEEIGIRGFGNSQIKILALLTRLRQICCHPSLFIENYKGDSSKLNQCIEITKDAIQSGHKILLFSGYTSMFDMIEKELKKEKISYLKLTGQTKVNERVDLVDQFNENSDIKVFLISLKAGGTGLNLTGADMVIHYDPWWNLSAENQATDRAYRIGQKNNVQVYKLITKNTIEERIYELQKKKAKLIDSVLDTKTSFISKLSKEDIMNLFQ